ncbi:MAG: hypothetical protein K9I94_04640 [Bacteroidales bacterium]|nr:hypothetical protein [Bacteroidales bacterium]
MKTIRITILILIALAFFGMNVETGVGAGTIVDDMPYGDFRGTQSIQQPIMC